MNNFARNNFNMLKSKLKKTFSFLLLHIKELKGEPHYVAIGISAGVFVAITPTIPFHTVLALLLATIIRGSKVAAVLGVWLSNPLTIPIFYVYSYKVGLFILGPREQIEIDQINSISDILLVGFDFTIIIMLGGIILGIISSIFAYSFVRGAFVLIKFRKRKD